jgi:hypothetical protein
VSFKRLTSEADSEASRAKPEGAANPEAGSVKVALPRPRLTRIVGQPKHLACNGQHDEKQTMRTVIWRQEQRWT